MENIATSGLEKPLDALWVKQVNLQEIMAAKRWIRCSRNTQETQKTQETQETQKTS